MKHRLRLLITNWLFERIAPRFLRANNWQLSADGAWWKKELRPGVHVTAPLGIAISRQLDYKLTLELEKRQAAASERLKQQERAKSADKQAPDSVTLDAHKTALKS